MLLKSPGFTAVAVLSLALGIGASTAIFSLVNAILLSSLPVPNPQELRLINWSGVDFNGPQWSWGGGPHAGVAGHWTGNAVSMPVFHALREHCAHEANIFGYTTIFGGVTAQVRHEAVRADGLRVSGNFFSGMGVRPFLGRLFDDDDDLPGATPVVVLSYPWWEQQFDLDPGVIGRTITLNGFPFTIVGVTQREFPGVQPGASTQFYIPQSVIPQLIPLDVSHAPPDPWSVLLMARLKPAVSAAQCQAALNVAFASAAATFMKQPAIELADGSAGPAEQLRGQYRTSLLLLLGVVGVVLLVACANVAGLSLARGAVRQHEFAVRAALGASRWRLIRQSLMESLLIALLGGASGMLIASWSKTILLQLIVFRAFHFDVHIDFKVLGFTLAVSLITALLSGLLPALKAASVDPLAGLQDRATASSPRLRAGRFLVAAQIALSLLLVAGGGLFVRTLINLAQANPGFAIDHLLLFHLTPRNAGYDETQATALIARVQKSLAAIPGVQSVMLTEMPLLNGAFRNFGFTLPGRAPLDANISIASETFLQTLGIPLRLGRDLRASDDFASPNVVVVNQAFVRKYFPNTDPIGQSIRDSSEANWQIVGVCRDAEYVDVKTGIEPTVLFSFRQHPLRWGAHFNLRTTLPPLAMLAAARQAVAAIDPNLPLTEIHTEEQVRDESISQERMFAELCGSLAFLAVMLSCIGLYGLMAYHVARRTAEIGIRMALGATRGQIAAPVLREALLLAGIGVIVGTPLSLTLTRLIRSNLYGLQPSDPVTFIGAAVLLFVVALVAAWIPARRAARIEPMIALRHT
jgi:predicted permease